MTYEEIQTKLSLYWETGRELQRAKLELEYARVAVRAYEQEIALKFLTDDGVEWIDKDRLYLIGRQIAKALPHPIG